MSPTQARAFYAVAQAGSFTAAAKALNVSQPTVTTQVRELEAHYGVELFYRHPRGVELTDVGRELLVIIRRLQADQQDAIEYLQTVRDLHTGHLRVGSYGPYDVIEILSVFTRRHPGLSATLTFGNSKKLGDDLINHQLDVGVFTQLHESPEFYSFAFSESKPVLIASKSHQWGDRQAIRVEELRNERLIIREPGSEVRRTAKEVLQSASVEPANVIEIGSREGTIAAVAQGMGVSLMLDEGLIPEDLVTKYRIQGLDMIAQVDVVCQEARRNSRIIGCFLEIARQLLASRALQH